MDQEMEGLLVKLTQAVEAMMSPSTPHQQRLEAYQMCEDFKENSPQCSECGVRMASKDQPPIVRHFGLQLLEHCVKCRWYKMNSEEKLFIKDNTMKLLASGTYDLLTEHCHIKDGLTRIVVEMMKREWPQHWPSLMQELDQLCKMGETQTELVLFIFLRLAEDTITFMNVPTQRRREMTQALSTHMAEIYTFFISTLREHYDKYIQLKGQESAVQQQMVHRQVVLAVLNTLTGYVDWIPMNHISDNGGVILEMLCLMLSDEQLQLYAAECLLLITSRKGKPEERKPLLVLFSDDAMSAILNAARMAANASTNEYYYLFFKRLCQVLTSIGSQLCTLWDPSGTVQRPPNFDMYLTAILAFTEHPSQMLGSFTQILWASFFRHDHIKDDPVLQGMLPRIMEVSKTALLKVGFPSQNNSPSCDYSRLDFDSDEDFSFFFSKYRAETADTIRLATLVIPVTTFQCIATWLHQRLAKPVNNSNGDHCNLSSPDFLEWDALSICLESVMSRLVNSDKPKPPVEDGICLLKAVLAYDAQDPMIMSCVLSSVSALFPYITDAPDTLPVVLDKIFSAAMFNLDGQTKATRSRAVKNVRRHACSVLVKMCRQYPHLLLPGFEQLYTHIQQLSSDPEQLSQMEKCTLMEALILISNEFKNFERQGSFIGEVLAPVKSMWLSDHLKQALWSTDKFITYIGVDQAPVEPSDADTCGINRSRISYCVNTILAALKRTKWPGNFEEAKHGGFAEVLENGNVVMRNPAMPHIGVMLDNVLALIRTMNAMWLPENLIKRHPEFVKAYDLTDVDRLCILSIQPPCVDNTGAPVYKNPVERMQNFFTTTNDNCYHILGNVGQCLGHQFYSASNLATSLLNSVFTSMDHIPDYRFRPVIRTFLKPFIQFCPKEQYGTAVVPILAMLCPVMLQRLTERWHIIHQRQEQGDEDENPESQEVLEDHLTRLLTREYLELINHILLSRRVSAGAAVSVEGGEDMMVEEAESQTAGNAKEDSLSDLGQLVSSTEDVFPAIVLIICNGFTWNDTSVCTKCTGLCWPLLKQLVTDGKLGGEDACHLFKQVLLGLQKHGQHEGNMASLLQLGVQAYELLRPVFPDVANVMLMVPNCKEANLKAFEEKLLNSSPAKQMPEKKKREGFKKLVQDIIGKSIGEKFKQDIRIKNLPPMMRQSKPKPPPALDNLDNTDIGLCALFGESTAKPSQISLPM